MRPQASRRSRHLGALAGAVAALLVAAFATALTAPAHGRARPASEPYTTLELVLDHGRVSTSPTLAAAASAATAHASAPAVGAAAKAGLTFPQALAACGGAGKTTARATAATVVSEAFSASHAVNSGRVAVTLTAILDGVKELGGQPVTLTIAGPFERDADGQLSADLAASVTAAATTARVAIDLAPGQRYVGIDGTFYELPQTRRRDDVSGASGASGATGASGLLGLLGIDSDSWLSDPHDVGTTAVNGVQTEHVSARVDVPALLGEVAGLRGGSGATAVAGATGATGPSGLAGVLPLLGQAIDSATVDLYTGVADHILRRLDLSVSFTVPALAAGALDGLSGGSLQLDATLSDLNQAQTITTPANVQPSSKLLNGIFDLESQFGSLAPLFAGSGKSFGGLINGSGSAAS